MPKNQIGQAEFAASYSLAREWLAEKLSWSEAASRLETDFGVNSASAGNLLQAVRALHNGEKFTRSISAAAADYFVRRIASNDGASAARLAIRSIERHVAYYEGIQPSKMPKMRATLASLSASFADVGLSVGQAEFEAEVARFAAMPAEARAKALPAKGHKPDVTFAQVKIYNRSAAVVAQVLLRAGGICETCSAPAPFKRALNGEPFLEVHHKLQLAAGGEDTVENAIAVCPNCHRKHHFG